MFYKITRPKGVGRHFAYGITLAEEGSSVYVNNKVAAMALHGLGWDAQEVAKLPKGETAIIAEEHKYLSRLLTAQEVNERMKPKGKWLVTAPKGNLRFFVRGLDVRKPFTLEDYDLAMYFQEQGFKVSQLNAEPEPESPVEVKPESKVEGADETKPTPDNRKFPI